MLTFPSVYPVTCHTDHVGIGSTFVAVNGFSHNGSAFITQALDKGATTIVVQTGTVLPTDVQTRITRDGILLEYADNMRKELAVRSAAAAGNPAHKLTIVGITGTKGKSSTSWMLYHILLGAGYKTALLSTIRNYIGTECFKAPLTTPQPDYIQQFLALAVAQGVTHVVMEIAAQAVSLHRIEGISFAGLMFTNIDREHLEFYADEDAYFDAKADLLNYAAPHAPIISGITRRWHEKLIKRGIPFTRCLALDSAESADATYAVHITKTMPVTFDLSVVTTQETVTVSIPSLIGNFNALNGGLAASMALALGVDSHTIRDSFYQLPPIPGRLEQYVLPNGAIGVIDYAHNPLSYRSVLPVLRSMTDHLIVICGAGGDRDPGRRPIMGGLVALLADHALLTSDNPRSEDPLAIIQAMQAGIDPEDMHKVTVCPDREQAIVTAYALSKKGSIIALLGKGPDEYQIIGTTVIPFSEKQILQSL